ncbi:MAG TPA: flagellar filament capping protein FliD [Burkholderiales bacterium]|nr:flagellar filament capping protein FliD [Burkholderiales bacterium]
MSISGLGLYSQHNMDEAIVHQPAQQAKAAIPSAAADTQAKVALSSASYEPTISAYGQARNAIAYLNSTVKSLEESANAGNASGSQPGQMQNSSDAIAGATQAVQGFINAYNASEAGSASSQNLEALKGIGITSSNGALSLDSQAFRKALSANPKNTVKVFSALAEAVQQTATYPEPSPNQPASQYSIVSRMVDPKP